MNPKNKPREKYDYKVVLFPNSMSAAMKENTLDALGVNGWDLVSVVGELAYLKRLVK